MAPACRLALGFLLSCALLATGGPPAPVAAQSSCDWESYPDFCIPPAWEVGILRCADIASTWFTVYPPDPHGFDTDYDGYGCGAEAEGVTSGVSGEGVAPEIVEAAPVYEEPVYVEPVYDESAAIAGECDPSYPNLCLPPGSGDLNCDDVGASSFTVLPPDPHGFDGDGNGIGCES